MVFTISGFRVSRQKLFPFKAVDLKNGLLRLLFCINTLWKTFYYRLSELIRLEVSKLC